jgi:pimeloyl-ACP methyl ester carboxylesterase
MQDFNSESFQISVTGGELFVRQWMPTESTDQLPVVLLHDSLGCVEMWRDFPAQLAITLKRPVFAYDRLGFGQSSQRHTPPSLNFIDEEAKIIFPELCRALGLSSVVLFGHSVGGAMAVAIAGHQAQTGLCASVITESAQAFVEARTIEGILAAKKAFSDSMQFSRLAKYHGEKAQWVLNAWTEVWLHPEFKDWSLDSNLSKVVCPVLAIHGDQDEYGTCVFPQRIAAGVNSYSEAVILEGVGHVPHREDAQKILNTVELFLAKVERKNSVVTSF